MNHLHPIRALPLQALHQSPDGSLHHHLQSLPPGLQNLDAIAPDASDGIFQRYLASNAPQAQHALHAPIPFGHHSGLPHPQSQFHGLQPGPYPHAANRFDVIAAPPQQFQAPPAPPPVPIPRQPRQLSKRVSEPEPQPDLVQPQDLDDAPATSKFGQLDGLKLIPDPPNLPQWREKLFNVDDTITLTEEEFTTYFPHVDNVYSHRSSQRHKRKRFVSHYWDCRLKGRPPGTKKSTDPEKKKRKRVARERDLCEVKIKITEYFDVTPSSHKPRCPRSHS
ncbi:hypothetical protein K491DRAFT_28681 [Lophiostoma macrostomum CBS 122681]|uniref:FAR1 domain-containing protein n=1 Tax=Lophiostoma macrostomum CBS 122681 TaxID=1314788 RepID=A0A6A6T0M7_9PLEO|nr:hypothetical protein K491DRAFT_28681 [Lophiostoma macrostomum CBS 122681]